MSRKVLTVGVYDLLHFGHIELFRKAKAMGDYLIVAVQDSNIVQKYKPTAKLVYTTEQRCYMVSSIKFVNEVVVYDAVDEIVKQVDFDVFVKGPDQCHPGFQAAVKWCEENAKEVVTLPRTEGISTSMLKQLIVKNKCK